MMKILPKIISIDTLCPASWLSLKKISYSDFRGKIRAWETVERQNSSGAVVIIATLQPSERIILIRQFRPPAAKYVIEFPAGLIDGDESPETAAKRELKEETGYTGNILSITPPAYNSPGLTGETVNIIRMDVDETLPENHSVIQKLEESEDIEVLKIKLSELSSFLASCATAGSAIDSKLAAFAIALSVYKN